MIPCTTATPLGALKRASARVPSICLGSAPVVEPVRVVVAPENMFTNLILVFQGSVTTIVLLLYIATPYGPPKRAAAPVASVVPSEPAVPARVVTTPAEVIFLMVKLSYSVTYKLPAASIAISVGLLNLAAVPVPSADPEVP